MRARTFLGTLSLIAIALYILSNLEPNIPEPAQPATPDIYSLEQSYLEVQAGIVQEQDGELPEPVTWELGGDMYVHRIDDVQNGVVCYVSYYLSENWTPTSTEMGGISCLPTGGEQ